MSPARPIYRSVVHDSARWEGFEFRPGDIVITTPPKCGTTWMQQICSLLIFQDPTLSQPLADISPWLDMVTKTREEILATLAAQQHRRFIKTHTPLDGLPMDERVTYICVGRDPRDAAVSWDNHSANLNPETFFAARAKVVGTEDLAELIALDPMPSGETLEERFWSWVDHVSPPVRVTSTLWATLDHYEQALRARDQANVLVFHYADLKADLTGEMKRLADCLGIAVDPGVLPKLVEAASFEQMRQRADELVPNAGLNLWKENQSFFHSGTGGKWRAFFDENAQRRYEARVAELVDAEVSAWAHGGGA